ncbi:hypothetical protein [uncultured Pontibacter sp.]|uniref:hypothetical protein n=1 Tax=uncultured Pontibacter sp. TaxID=453356 RepID=UPI00261E5C4D|nr:hypothetical protein [uncultured Pontibacter sp.]
MKVDIGESIIYSWLRHEKQCQFVQLNWKTSGTWEKSNIELAEDIFEKLKKITDTRGVNLIGESVKLDQFLRQAEIDVLGLSINTSTGINNPSYAISAVDIAFHEGGLGYKNPHLVVAKKLARAALITLIYFKTDNAEIVFASPKVHKDTLNKLDVTLSEVERCFDSLSFDFKCIFNDNFEKQILLPVLNHTRNIADTSELFSRATKLLDVFGCLRENLNVEDLGNIEIQELDQDDVSADQRSLTDEISLDALSYKELTKMLDEGNLKIGEFAKTIFNKLDEDQALFHRVLDYLENDRIPTGKELKLLKQLNPNDDINNQIKDSKGRARYYRNPLKNNDYILYSQWVEARHKVPLKQMLADFKLL